MPICLLCGAPHEKFNKKNTPNKFCSQTCANRFTSTGRVVSDTTKEKIRSSERGKIISDETKKKQSKSAIASMDKRRKTKFEKYGDENYCNVEKANATKIKNQSFSIGIGKESSEFFIKLRSKIAHLPIEQYIFGELNNNTIISKEYFIYNKATGRVRLLDCYIKTKDNLEINIEFNERGHYKSKQILKDIERDNDILSARPNIKIIKIKQKDYNRDQESTINNLIKQLENICQT